MSPLPVIGIDLGTTYSCVGCLKNGKIETIANAQGNRTTPSIVAYTKNSGEVLVGAAAAHQIAGNPQNTIYDSKRIIGRIFGDPTIDSDIEKFPFNVIKGPNSDSDSDSDRDDKSGPAVFAITNGHKFTDSPEKSWVSPEQVAAELLKNLKASAEAYIGAQVRHAVITVPAYFNNDQRKATKKAGEMAGLNVLQLLNEPTAAALAYGEHGDKDIQLSNNVQQPDTAQPTSKTILVFDLGGGTFDVSLLNLTNHQYNVIAVDGDNHLGGEDFTNLMVDHLLKEFAQQTDKTVQELSHNSRLVRRLRDQCEKAKQLLSSSQTAMIQVENLLGEHDLYTSIDQKTFEDICHSLFDRLTGPLDTVLQISKIDKSQVDDVVLVGGATRMPKVKDILRKYFDKDILKETVSADEAVGYGATIMAVKLAKDRIEELDDEVIQKQLRDMMLNGTVPHSNIVVREVTPMSISSSEQHNIAYFIIPRNTPIPVSVTIESETIFAYQRFIKFDFYEGESLLAEKNNLLGSFDITDLTPRRRGQTKVEVNITIDRDGIMKIRAYECRTPFEKQNIADKFSSKPAKELVIENVCNTLTMEQRLKMIQRQEDSKANDEIEYRRRLALKELFRTLHDALSSIDCFEMQGYFVSPQHKAAEEKLKNHRLWYDPDSKASRNEIMAKISEIKNLYSSLRFSLETPQKHKDSKQDQIKQSTRKKFMSKFTGGKKE